MSLELKSRITGESWAALGARTAAIRVESQQLIEASRKAIEACDSTLMTCKAKRLIWRISREPSSLLAIAERIRRGSDDSRVELEPKDPLPPHHSRAA